MLVVSAGVLTTLLAVSCGQVAGAENDRDSAIPAPKETVLLPVGEASWLLNGAGPTLDQLPVELRELVPLVPVESPAGTVGGSVEILIERSQPFDNLFGRAVVDWDNGEGNRLWATVKWTADKDSPNCGERFENLEQNGEWAPITVRGVEGCSTSPGPEILIVEWSEGGSYFHYEANSLSDVEATRWLDTWVPIQ